MSGFGLFHSIEDFFAAAIIGFTALLNCLVEATADLAALLGELATSLFARLRRQQQGDDDSDDDAHQNAYPNSRLCAPGTLLYITHNLCSFPRSVRGER
jgi:hypothetical protein